ncbi:putative LRR receptor-like serine/threonine-protein kinase [Prunus yedoensis var. nudiflora]|uniref:non-specific serine/threonine protein kinase n=1 Tax=Prunus yedoensis var. nudiflora TaxID=2094558 RepID=A0A314V450_PRUYE|nr:putative LRR receptor-like serine/threonine-protein kinase [Prunus yedoensis var. nudiflora]
MAQNATTDPSEETVYASRDTQTSRSLGRRVFDIYIQGNLRRKDFDKSKEAGGVNGAVARPFKVNVTENYLDIHLFWADKPTTPGKKSRTGLIVGIAVPVEVVI